MPSLSFGDFHLHCEAPEAARYRASVLVLPGLFQSFACWRPMTSMLAHRGWEVYCLARTMPDRDGNPYLVDQTWNHARTRILEVSTRLGGPVIVLAGDVGAALAMSLVEEVPMLAMALFSPSDPSVLGSSYRHLARTRPLRALGRLLGNASADQGDEVVVPSALLSHDVTLQDTLPEPRRLLDELEAMSPARPGRHPPALVFASANDPLVAEQHALTFATGAGAKASRTRLDGHFFALASGAHLADEVQRFLILTLGDRVVDFPEEILED